MPQRILALDIGDAEVKAALLEASFREYRVAGFYRQPLAAGAGTTEEQVRRFVDTHQLAADTVLSCLSGTHVAWRTLFLPFRDRKRLNQTIPFELESHVPFGMDEMVIDYQVLHRDRAGTTVLAALVPKDELQRHLGLLQAAGFDPKIVDLGPLSTLNALSLIPDRPATFAFVDVGSPAVTVALYRNGELAGLRTLIATPQNGNGAGPAASALAPLVADIRWTLLALNGAPLDDQLPCYVAGAPEDCALIEPLLAEALGVAVQRLDRLSLRTLDSAAAPQAAAFTTSLGLALREVTPSAALGLNFRQGEFTYHRAEQELRRGLRGLAALAAVVVALTLADLYIQYRTQMGRLAALDANIRTVFHDTLPDISGATNPIGNLQEEIDLLQRSIDQLNEVVPVSNSTTLDILRAISAAVPNHIRIDADDFTMDPDAIRFRANTDTFESVDTIKQQLLGTGFFRDVQVREARQDPKDSSVNFRMTLVLSKSFRPGTEAP
jgi:general secretion pathway protein L